MNILFSLHVGDIVPGIGIGTIKLGCAKDTIQDISSNFVVQELPTSWLYVGSDIKIWVDKKENVITQVLVFGGFCGKFMSKYGIGACLSEIEREINDFAYNELDVYKFKSINGICFELEDLDRDWDSETWFTFPHKCNFCFYNMIDYSIQSIDNVQCI